MMTTYQKQTKSKTINKTTKNMSYQRTTTNMQSETHEKSIDVTWLPYMDGIMLEPPETMTGFADKLYRPRARRLPVFEEICLEEKRSIR
jgi:hypothetical protein